MALRDPVAVYNAATNFEAQLICNLLNEAGIEAHTTEDGSPVGVWLFGLLPEIHKPQVWADRSEIDRVKPILDEYERQQSERNEREKGKPQPGGAKVEAICEECGKRSLHPAAHNGTVQDCPHCGAYVDVGDSPDADQWWREPGGENAAEEQ